MKTLNGKAALRVAQEKLARQSKGSGELYERSRQLMPGGVTSNIRYADPHPLYIRDARGARIRDVDGHEYVDCRLGFGPVILGHAPEGVTASVMRALNAEGDRIRREVPANAEASGIPLSACGLGSLFAFRFVDGPVISVRDAASRTRTWRRPCSSSS
jgi:glutamate-1-semialdehyde aminotransferase